MARSSSSAWVDYDNDGWLDLFVANAVVEDNDLYHNNGDGTFTAITSGAVVSDGGHSVGVAFADYNNDGYMDLAISNDFASANFLYLNNGGSNNWVQFSLGGVVSNYAALGAKLRLYAGGIAQLREITGQTGHGAQNELRAHFGIGSATSIDSLVIEWPSCLKMYLSDVAINQVHEIKEALIASDPEDTTVCPTQDFSLSVETYDTGYNYQWKKDGVNLVNGGNISGANSATLTVTNVQPSDAGDYTCLITGSCAGLTEESDTAFVSVESCLGRLHIGNRKCS